MLNDPSRLGFKKASTFWKVAKGLCLVCLYLYCNQPLSAQDRLIQGQSYRPELLQEMTLNEINRLRKNFQLPPIQWESQLAKTSQKVLRIRQRDIPRPKMLRKINRKLQKLYAQYDPITAQFLDLNYQPDYGPTFTYDLAAKEAVRHWYGNRNARPALLSNHFGTAYITTEIDRKAGIITFALLMASPDLKDPLQLQNQDKAYGLKNGLQSPNKACTTCQRWLERLPREVSFHVEQQGDSLFLFFSHPRYLPDLLQNKKDGFAVDILSTDQFGCATVNRLDPHWAYDGYLTEPRYFPEFAYPANTKPEEKAVYLKLGPIPQNLPKGPKEYNLLFIQDGVVCLYNQFLPIESYRWHLLKMPLLMDTTLLPADQSNLNEDLLLEKEITYTVPFSKNKAAFEPEDFQELYQKLNLTDYQIRRIDIKAYSSVEGTREENLQLQKQRAQSMLRALESYQHDSIKSRIETYENWVEFYEDISQSMYKDLVYKSKPEIKKLLNEEGYYQRLEPYLKKHRKAICHIYLSKRKQNKKLQDKEELIRLFQSYLEKGAIEKLALLQQQVFQGIQKGQYSHQLFENLPLPRKIAYGSLINNRRVFQTQQGGDSLQAILPTFRKLYKINPQNPYILYNLVKLELENWARKEKANQSTMPRFFDRSELEKHLHTLQDTLPKPLTQALSINYYIVLAEYLMEENQFEKKDRVIRQLANTYLRQNLQPAHALHLSQYLNSYHMYEEAFQLLNSYVVALDASEDILFYYLNMTLTRQAWRERAVFQAALTNAANTNHRRFCALVNGAQSGKKGSFQLLRFDALKSIYCEYCENE